MGAADRSVSFHADERPAAHDEMAWSRPPDAEVKLVVLPKRHAREGGYQAGTPRSNCIFYEPVSGRVQGWRGRAPPPPAASALSPSARRFFCLACARSETERLSGARSAHDVVRRIPLLAALDHDVENADQLAHAGGQRDLLQFAPGEQALVEGLQGRIVPRRRSHAGHVQRVARSAASALDVPLSATSATVIIVRRNTPAAPRRLCCWRDRARAWWRGAWHRSCGRCPERFR